MSNVQSGAFSVTKRQLESATVVSLSGELDIQCVPNLLVELRDVVSRRQGSVIMDVRELDYIDSAGLGVIASTYQSLSKSKRTFLAVGGHGLFERVMRLTQLDRQLPCLPSLEDALERLRASATPIG